MSSSARKTKSRPKKGKIAPARLKRMDRAVDLHGQGLSERAIAEKLGVSGPMIHYDLQLAKEKYLATINAEMAAKVAVKLQQYEDATIRALKIAEAAWASFEKSKEKRVKNEEGGWDVVEGPGNPMFLTELRGAEELLHKVLKAERELLDLDGSALPAGVERSSPWPLAEMFRQADAYRAETAKMIQAKVSDAKESGDGEDEQAVEAAA